MTDEADKIATDFERFHAAHPEVYEHFDRFARRMVRAGFKRGSANLIFERIRWETQFAAIREGGEPVALNNNYRALYARMWEDRNPAHRGFFRKRVRGGVTENSTRKADPIYGATR